MRFPGFIGPSYQLESVEIECQRCINMYPEVDEAGTEKDHGVMALIGTPGLALLTNLNAGPVRGSYVATNGALYVVSNNTLFTINSSFAKTSVGTITTASGPVSMADNGIDLVLVDGSGNGWYTALGSATLTQIVDPNWLGANQVSLLDGIFVFNKPGTFEYYVSNLLSVAINPLGFASKESPDPIVGFIADHRNLWLFGTRSTEVWFNAGLSPGVPFQIIQGAYLEVGCAAAFSIAQMANTLFWLGNDPRGGIIVYMTNGYSPQRVSTQAVELAIQSYGDVSGATAYTYQQNGHNFYVLNFTNANTTWVYDSTTQLWHERVYLSNGQFQRHLGSCHAYFNNMHVIGDYQSGNLYQLSMATYTDNGAAIVRQRITPHISADMNRVFYSEFQLDMETGVGADGIGQGTNPMAMLTYSNDGGHSWSNEKWASMGRIGHAKARATWRRLGSARDRVYKVTITDPVKVILIGAELALTAGNN